MAFNEGWTYRPDDIAESHARMQANGLIVSEASANAWRGKWSRSVAAGLTYFLACTVEGQRILSYCQATGVCTSMIYRALQDCLNWDRIKNKGIGREVSLCFEPLFAGSRINIGNGALGSSDGSVGAWIAEFVARFGVLERGVYRGVDLTAPNEKWAQSQGRPGSGGVPQFMLDLGRIHRFKAHKCPTTDELADAIANGCFGGVCRPRWAHRVDSQGYGIFDQNGGHHTSIRGGLIDRRTNKRAWVEQQTHGPGVPDPNPIAPTTEGDIPLSDGAYLCRDEEMQAAMDRGEVWVFQVIEGEEFR